MKRVLASASTAAVVCALVSVTSSSAHAAGATLSVPSRYRTITAAIAAARSGDTVLVAPGTYRENITISGKYVKVKASSSNPAQTVIAGNSGRSPVMFQNVPSSGGASLQGFRIVSGSAPSGQGGGITVANNASPTIQGNDIESNRSEDGGGILVYNHSSPTIIYNTIKNNTASTFGGGVFAVIGSSPQIYGNTITGNHAYGGGGIYLEDDVSHTSYRSTPNVSRNNITNNRASQAGGGIMLRTGVNAVIARNTISGNAAPYGGGIHLETTGSTPTVTTNVITGNSAITSASQPGSGSGGGIAVFGKSRPGIGHNTITGNRASKFGGGIVLAESSVSVVTGNNIAKNSVVGTEAGAAGGGIFEANSDSQMVNNVLRQNTAPVGGGVAVSGTGSWTLVNNTVVSNTATQGGQAAGGGLYVSRKTSGKMSVVNNVFNSNNDYQIFEYGAFATYYNNLVTNDGRGMFFSFSAHPVTTISALNNSAQVYAVDNVTGSPGFLNGPAFDYRIAASSPAVDAARSVGAPTVDIRNVHRPTGVRADIGAYEYKPGA